jgi:chromosome segregation ATPase
MEKDTLDLTSRCTKAEEQNSVLQQRVATLEQQTVQWQQKAQDWENKWNKLAQEKMDQQQSVHHLEDNLREQKEQNFKDVLLLQNDKDNLTAQLNQERANYALLEKELTMCQERAAREEQQMKEGLESQLEDQSNMIINLTERIKSLEAQGEAARSAMQAAEAEKKKQSHSYLYESECNILILLMISLYLRFISHLICVCFFSVHQASIQKLTNELSAVQLRLRKKEEELSPDDARITIERQKKTISDLQEQLEKYRSSEHLDLPKK